MGNLAILVAGLPGTGKSFLGKALAAEIKAVYLDSDQVRVKAGLQGRYDEQSRAQVYERMRSMMAATVNQGFNCVVDATFQDATWRRKFRESAIANGANLKLILMKSADGEVTGRLQRSRKYSDADYEVYQQLKEQFDQVRMPHLELHSDQLSLEQMLSKAKTYLDDQE